MSKLTPYQLGLIEKAVIDSKRWPETARLHRNDVVTRHGMKGLLTVEGVTTNSVGEHCYVLVYGVVGISENGAPESTCRCNALDSELTKIEIRDIRRAQERDLKDIEDDRAAADLRSQAARDATAATDYSLETLVNRYNDLCDAFEQFGAAIAEFRKQKNG